ncbi:MAG: FtsX-like permease family protein [Pseudomonadota bacterium]|nr:FtsX-like permease family protein [Pseudomonadota bacterium]
MKIPFSYIFRNLWTRKLTTLLTAGGMGLVVFVFAAVLMLDAGLKKTLVSTGSLDNVILLRQSAQTEIQSSVTRDQASLIETIPEVARGTDGAPLVSKETLVLTQIPRKGSDKPANVVVRGLPPLGLQLRPQVKLAEGRMFRAGSSEIIVGRGIAEGFEGVEIGQAQRFAGREWIIVGVFDGGKSAFDSEMWGDVEQMMQAFRRTTYSSAIARLQNRGDFAAFKGRVTADQRLTLDVKQEPIFYEEQSKQLSTFISILGITLSVIFSIGAMIGAMITMYAAVSNRTGEIGTLRALGFRRSSILAAFLIESILLALVGGVMGLALASGLQAFTITTMNWQSFSQLAFGFHLTPAIVVATLLFSVFMGFVGGFLPSLRAARLEIVDSLRAA